MLVADSALMGSQKPAFQQRDHSMYAWQQFGGLLGVFTPASNLMIVAGFLKPEVANPAVRVHGAAWRDEVFHKTKQAFSRGVRNDAHSNPADDRAFRLHSDYNQSLGHAAAADLALFQTAEIGFVHLNPSR